MKEIIRKAITDSIETKKKVHDTMVPLIEESGNMLISALKSGKKILVCGNGGSASQAQHFVAEIVVRYEKERGPLPAISLTVDTSILTAGGNDYGFENVFARQVEALGNEGDVLVGITTSGNSPNVIHAFESAKKKGMKTICLNGKDGGNINKRLVDMNLIVLSNSTARIQEAHITIIHVWCQMIDGELS
jgi:D-sedoheptulose 7-phosphate isomerase